MSLSHLCPTRLTGPRPSAPLYSSPPCSSSLSTSLRPLASTKVCHNYVYQWQNLDEPPPQTCNNRPTVPHPFFFFLPFPSSLCPSTRRDKKGQGRRLPHRTIPPHVHNKG